MASVTRRKSTRKKTQKPALREQLETARSSWTNEALAVVCCALALFFFLSFISHELNVAGSSPQRNLMGPLGHFSATMLSGFLGWCALVPVLWLGWVSWYFWNCEDDEPLIQVDSKLLVIAGLGGMLIFAATLGAMLWGNAAGGSIGQVLGQPLLKILGLWGGSLVMGAMLLICVALTTGQSVGTILLSLWDASRVMAQVLCIKFPLLLIQGTVAIISLIGRGCSAVSEVVFAPARSLLPTFPKKEMKRKSRDEEEDEIPLPKPRIRKNLMQTEARDEAATVEADQSEDVDSSEENEVMEASVDEKVRAVVRRRVNQEKEKKKDSKKKGGDQAEEDSTWDSRPFSNYTSPSVNLLAKGEITPGSEDDEELLEISKQIESKLRDFAILGRVTQVHPGPVITLFEFEPAPGVKVGKIAALQDDLAMSLKASSIRIIAPIPKRGTVGIEVPNRHRDVVRLRDLLESEAWSSADSSLSIPIGKDTYGDPVICDISTMPHLLMAGATGTGKSVCINAIIVSLLYRASPEEMGLILIDPKILELSVYEDIPHLRVPVVTVPRQAKAVLEWAVNEMNRRYRVMQKFGVRNIDSYNKVVSGEDVNEAAPKKRIEDDIVILKEEEIIQAGIIDKNEDIVVAPEPATAAEKAEEAKFVEELKPLPKIVIVIDELADLMLSVGRDIEELITRLAQKARAAGIHLIVATQRPSVDVITGLIKANFPARLSFRVSSRIDSRTILDSMGADKLLGRGDMLFMLPGAEGLKRVHGAFVSDSEVKNVVASIKEKCPPHYDERIMAICDKALEEEKNEGSGNTTVEEEYDEVYDRAVELVLEKGQASTSMLQRAFRIGYNRAARIIEMMEREGVVGPMDGAKPREVLVQNNVQEGGSEI